MGLDRVCILRLVLLGHFVEAFLHFFLYSSQLTDPGQDRLRRVRGRLQGAAGERRVGIASSGDSFLDLSVYFNNA